MIRTLRPSGAGASAQCSRTGDSANWRCVDEAVSDGDVTFVWAATAAEGSEIFPIDSYAMENLPAGLLGAIREVRVFLLAKYQVNAGGHARITPRIRLGSTYYNGAQADMSGTYGLFSKAWTTRPSDSAAWTPTDVDGAQGSHNMALLDDGIAGFTEGRVTQVYLEVEHVRVFQPAAPSMAMAVPQPTFRKPGPPAAPPKLSAAVPLTQSGSGAVRKSGGASLAVGLRTTASLPAWISHADLATIPSFPQYSGLLNVVGTQDLNPGFTTHAETAAATAAMVDGTTHVFPDQSGFEVTRYFDNGPGSNTPDPLALKKIFTGIDPARHLGMYVNAMSVPLTQPVPPNFVYFPIQLALYDFLQANNGWLRRTGSGTIVQGSAGWGVFDVRTPGFAALFGSLIRQYAALYGITTIFFDEIHYTVDHLSSPGTIANKPTDAEQTAGVLAILEEVAAGGLRCVWNGLLQTVAAEPEEFGGRMIQSAANSTAASVLALMDEVVARFAMHDRICMLEQQSDTVAQRQYLACLATLRDGQSGCGANNFTTPINMPYLAGAWGRPLEYVNRTSTVPVTTVVGNVETRELEFATVGVNRATKTAIVTPRP